MHTYTHANGTFNGPVINLLSILCILKGVFSRSLANGEKSRNDFELGTFIDRFPSDGMANMTAKGLNYTNCTCYSN